MKFTTYRPVDLLEEFAWGGGGPHHGKQNPILMTCGTETRMELIIFHLSHYCTPHSTIKTMLLHSIMHTKTLPLHTSCQSLASNLLINFFFKKKKGSFLHNQIFIFFIHWNFQKKLIHHAVDVHIENIGCMCNNVTFSPQLT